MASANPRSTVIPAMRCRDAPAAIEWLCSVIGLWNVGTYVPWA